MEEYYGYISRPVGPLTSLSPEKEWREARTPVDVWNKPGFLETRNCYAFACNAIAPDLETVRNQLLGHVDEPFTYYIPGPGSTGGRPFASSNASELRQSLEADGFIAQTQIHFSKIRILRGHTLIAGYAGYNDFHFYRYFSGDKSWYHKKGWGGVVSNLDFSGKLISNPFHSDRGPYQCFIGFFLSPPDRKPLNIVVADKNGRIVYGQEPQRPMPAPSAAEPKKHKASL